MGQNMLHYHIYQIMVKNINYRYYTIGQSSLKKVVVIYNVKTKKNSVYVKVERKDNEYMATNYFDLNTLSDLLDEMEMVYKNDERPWVLGYSGGKDSSATLHMVFKMLERLDRSDRTKPVYVISSDTMIENPVIKMYLEDNIEKINDSAKKKDLPITAQIVYPQVEDSYWVNVCGKGYPTPKSLQFRWCTDRLKIRPSNKFIKEKLNEEDVVVLLGVRKDESIARKKRIEKNQIEGYLLTPHRTLRGKRTMAYVYTPIVELTTADVWDVLYHNNDNYIDFGGEYGATPATAWGSDAFELFNMYLKGSGDSGECPFVADESSAKSSCGNSRFGCWICTVVKEDKSLNGFIESGHIELKPLVEFRRWLLAERDKEENRKKHKRNGRVNIKNGKIMPGSFTIEARRKILEVLLITQTKMQEFYPELELVTHDELREIERLWEAETLDRMLLQNTYKEIMGVDLPWREYVSQVFDDNSRKIVEKKCEKYSVDKDLFMGLIDVVNRQKHYSNRSSMIKNVEKLLSQEYLHIDMEQVREVEQKKPIKTYFL